MYRHIIVVLAVLSVAVGSQATSYQWSNAYGDVADQQASSVAIDVIGNVIVLGQYDGTISFGPNAVACPTSDCLFLAKMDLFGNPQWTRSIDGVLKIGTNKLGVDNSLNICVVNEFSSPIDLGGGSIEPVGFRDGIVAKYDANGALLWTKSFGSASSLVNVKAANVDGTGNIIVVGTFTGSIDFGGATISANPFKTNMFVVKLNWNGAHLWSGVYEGGLIEITAVDTDPAGNAYVVGYHGAAFDFGGGSLASDPYNVFMVKYDSASGAHLWSQSLGSPATFEYAYDVAVGLTGDVHIAGHFKDPFDPGAGSMTSNGGWDLFVAKFNTNGNCQWNRSFGGTTTDRGYAVSVDGYGNVTVGGHFFFEIDLGGGLITGDPIDFCVARFGPLGNHQWSQRLDVDNLGIPNDKEYSISSASNINGEMAFAGSFKDSIDCGGGNVSAGGGWDTFVAKFGVPPTGIKPGGIDARISMNVHPNPFNPQTTITYRTPVAGTVQLEIYDVTGRLVRTLVDGFVGVGDRTAAWNGRDNRANAVSSGVYFARLRTPAGAHSQRIVLLK